MALRLDNMSFNPEMTRSKHLIRFAKEACKEQRKICSDLSDCPECGGTNRIIDALEPELL